MQVRSYNRSCLATGIQKLSVKVVIKTQGTIVK